MPSSRSPTCVRGPARQAGRQRRSHSRRRRHGLCRRSRAGAAPRSRACWRRRAVRVHASRPMTARASCSARGCVTPTARPMCARSVEDAGLKLSQLEDRSARNEDNAPVPGLVAVAAKNLKSDRRYAIARIAALRAACVAMLLPSWTPECSASTTSHQGETTMKNKQTAARIRRHRACRHRSHPSCPRLSSGRRRRNTIRARATPKSSSARPCRIPAPVRSTACSAGSARPISRC